MYHIPPSESVSESFFDVFILQPNSLNAFTKLDPLSVTVETMLSLLKLNLLNISSIISPILSNVCAPKNRWQARTQL